MAQHAVLFRIRTNGFMERGTPNPRSFATVLCSTSGKLTGCRHEVCHRNSLRTLAPGADISFLSAFPGEREVLSPTNDSRQVCTTEPTSMPTHIQEVRPQGMKVDPVPLLERQPKSG